MLNSKGPDLLLNNYIKDMAVVEFEYIDLSLTTENVVTNYVQELMDTMTLETNSNMLYEEVELLFIDIFEKNIEATTSAYGE